MSGERHTRRRKTWLAGAAALALAGAGVAGWAAVADGTQAPRTGPLSAGEVRSAAGEFLDAWSDGDTERAASGTDDAKAAESALHDYLDRARLSPVAIAPGDARGTRVPYTVRAELRYDGARAPIRYRDTLTVVRRTGDGKPVVHWAPSVLHPRLGPGERLTVHETGAAPVRATDRDGARLDLDAFPSLAPVVAGLGRSYGRTAGGRPGLELRTVAAGRASGDAEPPSGETL
ncbi:penicillin-binding protein, partial [Streptomyces sp. SID5785]|uniref:NTF2-like N-terminal transpeptidase domain-containing protein n=1 Tax=Streptomyces sp. SID5785 TaxID=2690309 RepID=UPI00136180DE|nr:penicillin-binding protein [Streptomyces sp. SID5785]